jgi:phosphoribosylformimino-5-aminoimidazole carboxamide ribotide isomerase
VAAVILFPAIDLKDGQCVRLRCGDMTQATIYNADPTAQARAFESAGFAWLHVVDLDGAFAGASRNSDAVEAILKSVTIPVQLGGGIRNLARIEYWLVGGVRRVILGTAALRDPDLVRTACRRYPGRIVIGIDARAGRVAVEGWAETAGISAIGLARRFLDSGVAAIVFTDIDRDGVMTGLNIAATLALAAAVPIPVIASGGLASMTDIRRLCEPDCAILAGAISGRAIYDGRIDPAAALRFLREASGC